MAAAWPDARSARCFVPGRPPQQLVGIPGVDHRLRRQSAEKGALTSIRQPRQLTWGVRIRIDREAATGLHGKSEQALGRVEPFRPAVDLDGLVEALRGREDDLRVEI